MFNWSFPQALTEHLARHYRQVSHPGLLWEKFTPDNLDGKQRSLWLQTFCQAAANSSLALEACHNYRERWLARLAAAGGQVYLSNSLSRLIVGLGGEHVLETSITLDRGTGMPIIPGGAMKGVTRSWALIEVARLFAGIDFLETVGDEQDKPPSRLALLNEWLTTPRAPKNPDDSPALFDSMQIAPTDIPWGAVEAFQRLFGTTAFAGSIRFYDALYASSAAPRFTVDVMTPHFGRYYGNKEQYPSDDDTPVPVSYLVLEAGQPFLFGIALRRGGEAKDMGTVESLLAGALQLLGVGAKTNQGYGLFGKLNRPASGG